MARKRTTNRLNEGLPAVSTTFPSWRRRPCVYLKLLLPMCIACLFNSGETIRAFVSVCLPISYAPSPFCLIVVFTGVLQLVCVQRHWFRLIYIQLLVIRWSVQVMALVVVAARRPLTWLKRFETVLQASLHCRPNNTNKRDGKTNKQTDKQPNNRDLFTSL